MTKNQFFNDLADKGKIRKRTIVLQFILVKRCFFDERCNRSSFENFRKDARGNGRMNKSSKRRK